ncbi:MAG: hypothetical protein FJ143_12090 [Deltaproteobacteria bacterium]|nr:hypothetical protein [Deltaproteobacteria bacterium]
MGELRVIVWVDAISDNRKAAPRTKIKNPKSVMALALVFTFIWCGAALAAQPERVGVIYLGDVFAPVVDGLRAGLKELGVVEGKQVVLDIQDLKGDAKLAASVAEKFERDKFKLIFSNTVPVTTVAMKATQNVPIVLAVGSDPVSRG